MSREKEIRQQYEAVDHADQYSDQRWTETRHARKTNQWELAAVEALLQRATELNGAGLEAVLDMPCGFGRFQPLLSAHSKWLIQSDLAMSMLKRRAPALGESNGGEGTSNSKEQLAPTCLAMQASLLRIPLQDQCVDLNLCMRVLHHFADPQPRIQILSELARVSRFAIVSYYDAAAFPHLRDRIRRRQRTLYPVRNAQFDAEAARAGFRVVEKRFRRRWFSFQVLALLERQ